MIIYLTKETISRYGISLNQYLDEFEKNSRAKSLSLGW